VLPAQAWSAGINVKKDPFNAAGNGITDDTAAFAAARDAAGANGTVITSPATYAQALLDTRAHPMAGIASDSAGVSRQTRITG
jgi:hypothetical protein